jgi:transposase InsO family protein
MPRRFQPPSQTWNTFLANHLTRAAAIDFFVVPTATFRSLYVFVVLAHERRRIVHCNVTDAPSASWTGQQVINAFPYEAAPRYLHRDRDALYGSEFISRVRSMGIEQVVSAAHSPWQNPYVERVIGSLRRECTDHVIVTGAGHLRRVLREYLAYSNADRTHVVWSGIAGAPRRPPLLGIDLRPAYTVPRGLVGELEKRLDIAASSRLS